MPVTAGSALRCFERRPHALVRLFCLPHAGGSASAYRAWPALLPDGVELQAVQYPGREDRLGEPPHDTMDRLVGELAQAMLGLLDRPFALFGHSMGAAVAYEVALELRRRGARPPAHLLVSALEAPARLRRGDVHQGDDHTLRAELARVSPATARILDDPSLRALILPVVRNDYRLIETYHPRPAPPLHCPVTVFRGADDPEVTAEEADAWRQVTHARFAVNVLPGDHFYLVPQRQALVAAVLRALGVAPPPARWPSSTDAPFP